MHAQTVEATDWWARSRGATSATWIANYQRSVQSRQRTVIADILKTLGPIETVLEVGCHCGPNLMRLATELPHLRMIGIDANAEAIRAGRAWVAEARRQDQIQLNVGRFPEATASLATGSFDVVLSCYTVAYIAPVDLPAALYELGRLATRAVVIAEPMAAGPQSQGEKRALSGYSEWAHPYQEASRWVGSLRGMTTTIVPVSPPVERLAAMCVLVRPDAFCGIIASSMP